MRYAYFFVLAFLPGLIYGFTLSATIKQRQAGGPVLRPLLRNTDTTPITIFTGLRVDRAYPAAAFKFKLKLPHKSPMHLDCWDCGPGIIAGTVEHYGVTLPPNGTFETNISLYEFRYGGDQCLCTAVTSGAQLLIELEGNSVTVPLRCNRKQRYPLNCGGSLNSLLRLRTLATQVFVHNASA